MTAVDWTISDSRISGFYSQALSDNGGRSTIASSGCDITAYANLKNISPIESAQMSMEVNGRSYNVGTNERFFLKHGGKVENGWADAFKAIDQGKYVIYSRKGHYLLLYGYDDKNLYISDSDKPGDEKVSLRSNNKPKQDGYWYHGYSFSK